MYILKLESIILISNNPHTYEIIWHFNSLTFVLYFLSLVNSSESETKTVTDTVVQTVTDTLKPPLTIVGIWVGTYQVTGSPTTYYYSFDLRPDGTSSP